MDFKKTSRIDPPFPHLLEQRRRRIQDIEINVIGIIEYGGRDGFIPDGGNGSGPVDDVGRGPFFGRSGEGLGQVFFGVLACTFPGYYNRARDNKSFSVEVSAMGFTG